MYVTRTRIMKINKAYESKMTASCGYLKSMIFQKLSQTPYSLFSASHTLPRPLVCLVGISNNWEDQTVRLLSYIQKGEPIIQLRNMWFMLLKTP